MFQKLRLPTDNVSKLSSVTKPKNPNSLSFKVVTVESCRVFQQGLDP